MLDSTKYVRQLTQWAEQDRAARLPELQRAAADESFAGAIGKAALLPRGLSSGEIKELSRLAAEQMLARSYQIGGEIERSTKKDRDAGNEQRASNTGNVSGFSFMLQQLSGRGGAGDAKSLLSAEAIEKATPIIGAEGIAALLGAVGPDAAESIIKRRSPDKLERIASAFMRGHPALEDQPPLSKNSLVIDTNTAFALSKRANGEDMHDGERAQCAYLDARGGLDVRLTNVVVGEINARDFPARGVALSVSRESKEYRAVVRALLAENVGTAKGGADRGIIADVLFAKTEPGAMPAFATQDKQVYNALARMAGVNLNDMGAKTIPELYPNGFVVEVLGRRMLLLPIRNPGA